MIKHNVKTLLLLALFACLSMAGQAQINTPQPSPAAKISQNFGLAEVAVSYSRPGMKGRAVFGDLVPYGSLWRTGANAATKFNFTDEVNINGVRVPKGEYSLFTIPDRTQWTIILNKNANAGTGNYKPEEDVVRFQVKPEALHSNVETFTIGFSNLKNNSVDVEISWEKTMARFTIINEVDSKVMAQIDRALDPKKDAGLYFQIASYYYDSDKYMEKAYDLVNKSVDMDPKFWVVHLKAKIEYKLKRYSDAISTAEKSMSLARDAKNDDYVRLNEKLIAECRKMK